MSGPQISDSGTKCQPVCQLFINGFDKRSIYTLTNFPSLLSPAGAKECRYRVGLIDDRGTEVACGDVTVPVFGTVELIPSEFFGCALPEVGLFTAELMGLDGYEHLGMLRPYFYAMYTDTDFGSAVLVHPQTTFLSEAPVGVNWRSAQVIWSTEVDSLEVFQINPVAEAAKPRSRSAISRGRSWRPRWLSCRRTAPAGCIGAQRNSPPRNLCRSR
jgi:hypothetical protein